MQKINKSAPMKFKMLFTSREPRVASGISTSLNWVRVFTAGCMAIALVALSGCDSIAVALGTRVRLADIPIKSLSVKLAADQSLSPGSKGQMVIVATTVDGRQLVTDGAGGGKVVFDSFAFESSVVSVSKSGAVTLPSDPRLSEGRTPHVLVHVVGQPEVAGELDIPVRYNVHFAARFFGLSGASGTSGSDGFSGQNGSTGSFDINNPSPGGDGTDGSRGGDGGSGDDGSPGPTVQVWIGIAPGEKTLLRVRAVSNTREQFLLVDPRGGSLSVESNGGRGGDGGAGGRGGSGGSGGAGMPFGHTGSNGADGLQGRSGSDGPPGKIVVTVDPMAQPYLDRLQFPFLGRGPAPDIRVEPVGTLW